MAEEDAVVPVKPGTMKNMEIGQKLEFCHLIGRPMRIQLGVSTNEITDIDVDSLTFQLSLRHGNTRRQLCNLLGHGRRLSFKGLQVVC